MANGSHGDLFPVRFYQSTTPVNFFECNEPLQDLDANIKILDAKIADIYANGVISGGGGGPSPSPAPSPAALTGTVSNQVDATYDIPATPGPATTTIGTDIPALAFVHNAGEGQKLIVTVPSDYVGDGLSFYVPYQMSGAIVGTVTFSVSGEIAHVAGSITTFGTDTVNLSVNNSTNPGEALLYTLSNGTFAPGDVIRLNFTRANADINTATIKVANLYYKYTGFVALNRGYTFQPEVLYDTADPAPTLGTYGTDFISYDFPTGSDAGQKVTGIVPQEWDGLSDPYIKFTYAMSGAAGSTVVRIEGSGSVANIVSGMQTLSTVTIDNSVPNDTNPHQTIAIAFDKTKFAKGSPYAISFARRTTAVPSNSTFSWRVIGVEVVFGNASSAGGGGGGSGEHWLIDPMYSSIGNINVSNVLHAYNTTNEFAFDVMGVTASQSVTVKWVGRLASTETELSRLRMLIDKTTNTGTYRLRVFPSTVGASASYDTGSQTLIVGLTSVDINASLISPQPAGDGPYIVQLDLTTGAATNDHIYVQRPFVAQG